MQQIGRGKNGRFLPGNQIAAGNTGNRKPKWGNKNAFKHGFYSMPDLYNIDDGWLVLRIYQGKHINVRLHPDTFYRGDDGWIYLRDDVIAMLEERIHNR